MGRKDDKFYFPQHYKKIELGEDMILILLHLALCAMHAVSAFSAEVLFSFQELTLCGTDKILI